MGIGVLFAGDGVNDALAMKQADASLSVLSSAEVSFDVSGIHLLGNDLKRVPELLRWCSDCAGAIRIAIVFSLFYNVILGTVALSGAISPLIAVIIMPLSTVTLVFGTLFYIQRGFQK